MHIYYFDENFKYQGEDVISDYEEMPKNATSVRPEEGLYLPMYDEKRQCGANLLLKRILIACGRNRLYLMI